MSDVRDPDTDQQLPEPGKQFVQEVMIEELGGWNLPDMIQEAIERGIRQRRELGIRKYKTPLMTHNGRDALADAWDEALDLFTYLYQLELEDPGHGFAEQSQAAIQILEDLADRRIERGDVEFS